MTDNEKLIAEAERVVMDLDEAHGEVTYRELVAAALTVFEKAHTPTDDEREALERYHAALDRGLGDHEAREEGWSTEYTPTIEQYLGFANTALIASGMPEEEAFQITERVLNAHDAKVRAGALAEVSEPRVIERHDLVMPIYEDTPTDDEREALRDAIRGYDRPISYDEGLLDVILSTLRRTEEPSRCNCRECGVEEMMADSADDPRLVARRNEHNRERHTEPQGEPSDASKLIEVIRLWFSNWRSIGRVSPALEVSIDSLEGAVDELIDLVEPAQGEPSDAQVTAAMIAYHSAYLDRGIGYIDAEDNRVEMRAALRAAGAVR